MYEDVANKDLEDLKNQVGSGKTELKKMKIYTV